jgi:hypothetical protein
MSTQRKYDKKNRSRSKERLLGKYMALQEQMTVSGELKPIKQSMIY